MGEWGQSVIVNWTGVHVRALRVQGMRCTQQQLAEVTGFSVEVISKWERRGETITLTGQFAAGMDTLLQRLGEDDARRFRAALETGSSSLVEPTVPVAGTESAIASGLPALRRVLDTPDLPDDGPVRPVEQLGEAVALLVKDRLDSSYLRLVHELPEMLSELLRARLIHSTSRRGQVVNSLLAQAYRAADAVADKYGYYDLSARIITMMRDTAVESGDNLLMATAAYVRTEVFFASGKLATGRALLEKAADAVEPGQSTLASATYGSLHMRAAVAAARAQLQVHAHAHLNEAESIAQRVPEGVYLGTAFGPSSVRIHRVSFGVESGDVGSALEAADGWAPCSATPAERRSHFYVDLARAHMQAAHRADAITALQMAESIAPEHTASHPQVKQLLAEIAH